MESGEIIRFFEDVIVQIATPYSTGTGFYLAGYQLIITNEHVVRDNNEVVIAGKKFEKQLAKVLYIDSRYDLAFLQAPVNHNMPVAILFEAEKLHEGDRVIAVGHPFGLKYSATQGIISSLLHKEDDIEYIQHDAALNPGNSGGPLINTDGQIIGINTFIIQNGNNIGFSLPAKYLIQTVKEFNKGQGTPGVRCLSCLHIIFEKDRSAGKYCPICGTKITLISAIDKYEPYGINKTVEDMLSGLGYNVELSRRGPNNWTIINGSAQINVSYYEKTGLLTGDVYLCTLPDKDLKEIYVFLLKTNYILNGLTFSLRNKDIILSLLIYDQYLHKDTMIKLFNYLIETADNYDDILINRFNAGKKDK